MSNYNQHIKHWKNHRKDNHYQQCGFHFNESVKSYSAIAEKTAEGYYVGSLDGATHISPIYADSDDAVDYFHTLSKDEQIKCAIYTDKGMLIMR